MDPTVPELLCTNGQIEGYVGSDSLLLIMFLVKGLNDVMMIQPRTERSRLRRGVA